VADVQAGAKNALAVVLHKVGDDEPPPNHGITDVTVAPTTQGLAVRFGAARFGGPASAEVSADLSVDGARGPRVSLPLNNGGARVERTFTTSSAAAPAETTPAPSPTITVTLADDALTLDNAVTLPHEPRPKLRVLVIDGEPDAVPFADEVYYLTQALQSSRSGGGQSLLDVTVLPPERLDAASLAGTDVVVLANVARVEAAAAAALVSHVTAGAGLFMTMGDQVDPEAYNRDLQALLPAALRGTKQQALLDDANVDDVLGLARFDTTHPIFVAFASASADALPGLTRVRTRASMLVEPDARARDDGGARAILARFTNDAPALMERAVGPRGRGRVVLLTTSVDREWSDLPIRPGFLPLMEQVVLYLGRALDHGRPRTIRAHEPRDIMAPSESEQLAIRRPDGRRVTVDVPAGAERARFTDTGTVGLYVVSSLRGGDEQDLLPERFTVLPDAREFDLRRVDDDALTSSLPQGAVVRADQSDRPGEPLWPALLLLAVALMLAEAALVTRGDRAP